MLSAPVKSARRISSLFSLGSKDRDSHSSTVSAPVLNSSENPIDKRHQSSSKPTRHVSTPNAIYSSEPRTMPDNLDMEGLPPPPSLLAVNQDLASSAPSSLVGNPQSRGRDMTRPSSSGGLAIPGSTPDSRPSTPSSRRRSWMPGRSRGSSIDKRQTPMLPAAWIAGLDQKVVYDLNPLSTGEQIQELWNEQGDTYVYLFPQSAGRAPSFKVDSTIFAESPSLTYLARGEDGKSGLEQPTQALSLDTTSPPMSPLDSQPENDNDSAGSQRLAFEDTTEEAQELHLYLPIPLNCDVSNPQAKLTPEDTETLLLFRNLFAFLLGQSLIASPKSSTLFSIFMDVAVLLARFEFSNLDASNFGETATSSFSNYCEELRLADVRRSREKTIEAIVLGERLRYYPLYVEGFVHGVGKLDEIKQLRSPKYAFIHPITQKRLERAFIDLDTRLRGLYGKLEDFDFPSVFSGVANSTTSEESKVVRFKNWKTGFQEFRRFTIQYYRQKYGSWPPKARSKKNEFEENGLNRLLLLDLYHDFTDLYDLMVDRTSLTTRTIDISGVNNESLESSDPKQVTLRALRQVLSEYDRSTPPVLPPIPFDIPQIPSLQPLHRKPLDAKKEAKQSAKKLKDSDINAVLMASYTREAMRPTPFIESFMQFERRSAHGKNVTDLTDLRCGQWIFLYAVIQALPMLVVDVPDVHFNEGVEYFLCIAPRGGAPWIQNDTKTSRSWFGVAGGAGVVSLPSDVVINGVEGVYRRSHCWQVAEQWAEAGALLDPPMMDDATYDDEESSISSPYQGQPSSAGSSSDPYPNPMMAPGGLTTPPPAIPRTRSPTAAQRSEHRHSFYPGLEALPLPAGVAPIEPPTRPLSRFNPNMSFDDILKEVPQKDKKKH
ncbi:Zinc-binding dehydrogenase family protein [Penicillium digitatum]|uniref:DUF8004 domain-containing protein n=3 Tax=Penicillium digitatum TaxID=36651 RepID=K9FLH4_PEND2|nr:hypothetical protein PDIP_66580 [Penicillium digitatum Pd1]EKV09147.1 hypothetical protein PDIP_66580 [Penicillium digitatum Pd1]EKV10415.1 hypothetical protein PDIG_57040 [Penicillium digitatum PHI26]QQK41928.1 Zinc-binding dehydrogenase family protein [Penicillium digitatum]